MNESVIIKENHYSIVDRRDRISVADSFVFPANKIGSGNGEAKLYVGQNNFDTELFFGLRGFTANCIILRKNLIDYLLSAETEYLEPTQEYREKINLRSLFKIRQEKARGFPEIIYFNLIDQNQIVGPRVYLSSTDKIYEFIREISLPNKSFLDIIKIESIEGKQLFLIQLQFEDVFESIERETLNDITEIVSPFDPNKINVKTAVSTIGQIMEDLEYGVINLNTEFQRHPNLWDDVKKSRFIESLLLKLPIPAFYFNEKEENDLEVVDGLQRISTIKSFTLDKDLVLKNLEFLKEYNGLNFDALPPVLSRRIKTFQINTYIIEKGTPNEVKFNIFKRVNTGGLVLTPQEIRHAINQGAAANLVADLVRGIDEPNGKRATTAGIAFVKATDNSIGSHRMEDRDFATRFVAFFLISYKEYSPDLDTFLNKGLAKVKELKIETIDNLICDFEDAMNLAYSIFGQDAFRKRFNVLDSRKPINKALFEVLSVNFAKLNKSQRSTLLLNKEDLKQRLLLLQTNENGKFLRSLSQGTASKESVEQRFSEVEKIINALTFHD